MEEIDEVGAVKVLTAMAQPHRLRAFRALVVAGPDGVSAGTLAAQVGISPASLSFHLKELLHAGLVEPRRDGRHIVYMARFDLMNKLIAFLTAHCCQGGSCGVKAESCLQPLIVEEEKC